MLVVADRCRIAFSSEYPEPLHHWRGIREIESDDCNPFGVRVSFAGVQFVILTEWDRCIVLSV
jgi:hypothetical protein